ncbi:Exosome complex component rrp46 [Smittium culicis]|uniref:Exosome complex component rrp46 n=1 Tax=Smittium culicis TaxID=133412 RepID=A0A1R1XIM6_9FUNG|nr:Exosome complex component rrp46 [Smittium culicis]
MMDDVEMKSSDLDTKTRLITFENGLLNKADGSAKYSSGLTTVVCSINGPIETRIQNEKFDQAVIEVQLRSASGVSGTF